MLLLLIIDFVRVSSGLLVNVDATVFEDIVGLALALVLIYNFDCGSSFWNCLFNNLGAFVRLRIGEMVVFNMICLFFRQAAALLKGASGVRKMSCYNLNKSALDNMKGSVLAFEIPKFLQICSSSSKFASV